MLWCTLRLSEVYGDVYKNTCSVYTELSQTDSSLLALPLWSQTTTAWKTICMLRGSRRLVRTLSTASDEPFPKETQTGEIFLFFFFLFKKLVFFFFPQPRNFPQQIKSKLLKDWVHSCFDFFWYAAQPKRDLTTRQCSEDEHCPSDLTQCQCLVPRKSARGW